MIETNNQINEVSRALGSRTVETGAAVVATISQVYPTDADDLWDVVTNPERIVRWFMPVSGELKEGGSYQLTGNASGTITRCDRPRGFDATWEFGGQVSWIEVRLTPEGAGTRFQLQHIAQVPGEFWEQYGPGATGVGWDLAFLGLSRHIADPAGVPDPEEVANWHTTEVGRTFLRESCDRWAQAATGYGTDPAAAKEQADRTFAFYTGT